MAWSYLLQELVGSILGGTKSGRDGVAAGVFEYPRWYIGLKAIAVFGSGLFLVWFGASSHFGLSRFERGLVLVVGLASLAMGVAVFRGIRRIRVAAGVLTAEYAAGGSRSWLLSDLHAQEPSRFARSAP